jgi:hypothetical protein
MPVLKVSDLKFKKNQDGTSVAKLDYFGVCEAVVVRYPKGYSVPNHLHSGDILQVILDGEIQFLDSKTGKSELGSIGMLHKCAPFPYSAKVLKDSYVLLAQEHGTTIRLSDQVVDQRDEILKQIKVLGMQRRKIDERVDELILELASLSASKHGFGKKKK